MLLTDYQDHFKTLGKFIYATQLTPDFSVDLKQAHMALVEQNAEGADDGFVANQNVVTPLGAVVSSVISQVDGLQTAYKNGVLGYLQKVIAPALGLSASTQITTLGTALVADMTSVGALVEPSGASGSNSDGLAMYFATNFSLALPQNVSATIPDSYITVSVL